MQEFKDAIDQNDIETIKQSMKFIDPSNDDNWAIRYASYGHLEVVQILLSDSRVDPSADNNHAIRYASAYGHLEVVRLLLSDPRVDPSADDNFVIYWASTNGYIETVRLLLSDPRVDFNAIENKEMKRQLLKKERNKLREEFTFRYQVIQKASPQILIEGKQKSKIPSALIRKIVYDASGQDRSTSIRLLALASLSKN